MDFPFKRSRNSLTCLKRKLVKTLEELMIDGKSSFGCKLIFRVQVYYEKDIDRFLNYTIKYLSDTIFNFVIKKDLHLKLYEFQFVKNRKEKINGLWNDGYIKDSSVEDGDFVRLIVLKG